MGNKVSEPDNRLFSLLPDIGYYCLQFNAGWDADKQRHKKGHRYFTTKDDMAKALLKLDQRTEVWYAVSTYQQPGSRKRANVCAIRCVAIDVDIKADGGNGGGTGDGSAAGDDGSGGSATHYTTKQDAAACLIAGVNDGSLPKPSYIVESANGFHVYWTFDQDIDHTRWQAIANAFVSYLQAVAPKLIADTTSTRSPERVLRWPGTYNKKDPANPFMVQIVGASGAVYSPDAFTALIGAPPAIATVAVPQISTGLPAYVAATAPIAAPVMAQSRIPTGQDLAILRRCGALRELEAKVATGAAAGTPHKIPYFGWVGLLTVAKHFNKGREYADTLSKHAHNYNEDAFKDKWTEANTNMASVTCSRFCDDNDIKRTACAACPAYAVQGHAFLTGQASHDTHPADLAAQEARASMMPAAAPQPEPVQPDVTMAATPVQWVPEIPNVAGVGVPGSPIVYVVSGAIKEPQPGDTTTPVDTFWVLGNGRLAYYNEVAIKGGQGATERIMTPCLNGLVWPAFRTVNYAGDVSYVLHSQRSEAGVWKYAEIEAAASEMADNTRLAARLARGGIRTEGDPPAAMRNVRKFIEHCGRMNRNSDRIIKLPAQFGWDADKSFNVGTLKLTNTDAERARYDSTVGDVTLSRFTRKGDPNLYMDAYRYVFSCATDEAKLFMLGCLATPLLSMLSGAGENTNPIVNITGAPNTGKTMCLVFSQSAWGDPSVNQLTERSTINSAGHMFSKHGNLPVLFDEISNFPRKDELASIITTFASGAPKTAQTDKNKERGGDPPWASAMLCTSNTSIHDILFGVTGVGDTTLGKIRRVIEISVFDNLYAGDRGDLNNCKTIFTNNYGYLGPTIMHHAVKNYDRVSAMMHAERAVLDATMQGDNSGSFYIAYLSAINVVATLLGETGLMGVDRTWLGRASNSFKEQSITQLDHVRQRMDNILSTVCNSWELFTYKFRVDRRGNEQPLNNDLNKLMKPARIRFVEDHRGPTVIERRYIDRYELDTLLRKNGTSFRACEQIWLGRGYTVSETTIIIDAGASPALALGAGSAATNFGKTAIPCYVIDIDTGVPSPLP